MAPTFRCSFGEGSPPTSAALQDVPLPSALSRMLENLGTCHAQPQSTIRPSVGECFPSKSADYFVFTFSDKATRAATTVNEVLPSLLATYQDLMDDIL